MSRIASQFSKVLKPQGTIAFIREIGDSLLPKAKPTHATSRHRLHVWLILWVVALPGALHLSAQPSEPVTQAAPTPASPATPALFDLEKSRPTVISLDGQWRFHPGDDQNGKLEYARPTFDDSAWPLIRGDRSWDAQGYKGLSGVAWYRAKIRIPPGKTRFALETRGITDSSQIFLDGHLIGSYGDMPPNPRADYQIRQLYPLPLPPSSQSRVVTLAIRVWHWPHWAARVNGGILRPIRIGDAAFMETLMRLGIWETAWGAVDEIVLIFLWTLTGLAALTLFTLRRDREYLWFGIYLLLLAVGGALNIYPRFHAFSSKDADLIQNFLASVVELTEIAFYYCLLRGKRSWLFWTAIAASAIVAPIFHILMHTEYGNYAAWNMAYIALSVPFRLWILTLLFQRTRQGLLDARLLLAPVLLSQLAGITHNAILVAQFLGWRGNVRWFNAVSNWPFEFSVPDIADLLFLVAMVAIFLYRFYRTSHEQEVFQREREAARTIQQILVPEALSEIPGFTIHSVYKPAGEVGGDFFQIFPLGPLEAAAASRPLNQPSNEAGLSPGPSLPNGVLIVIGDVSGKGLPAAMMVSLLVGTLNTLVETTSQPSQILSGLNRRVCGRSSGGFTTCLVLRADPNGILTIANAGHLAPYLNGQELLCENSLPLGLAEAATYTESTFQLPPGYQLTLLTDGVPEARMKNARNATGELYGFTRTAAISAQSAEAIAQAAQLFGQDDDITVLTLTRQPA